MNFSKFKLEEISEDPGNMFGRVLWSQGLGYPLWVPQPVQVKPTECTTGGIQIGDVGIISSDGRFVYHFNIFLPPDHPRNKNCVPEGFVPLDNFEPNVIEKLQHLVVTSAGVHVVIRRQSLESGEGELCYHIQSTRKEDAALILPEGCVREDVPNTDEIIRYVSKYAADWYRNANGIRKEEVANGSLHVVTGLDKTAVWIAANFRDVARSPSGLAEFKIKATTRREPDPGNSEFKTIYKWPVIFNGQDLKIGPKPDRESRVANQTLFLRTVCVQLQDVAWKYLLIPRSESPISWIQELWGRLGLNWRSERVRKVRISKNFKNFSELPHPSCLITSYLLQMKSGGDVAIAQHSNWKLLLEQGEAFPSVDELTRRLKKHFTVEMDEESKAVFLKPRVQ